MPAPSPTPAQIRLSVHLNMRWLYAPLDAKHSPAYARLRIVLAHTQPLPPRARAQAANKLGGCAAYATQRG